MCPTRTCTIVASVSPVFPTSLTYYYMIVETGIAQSVLRLATSWTTEESEFEQEFSLLHFVGNSEGKRPLGTPRRRWVTILKWILER
jgi:hypothetical protein